MLPKKIIALLQESNLLKESKTQLLLESSNAVEEKPKWRDRVQKQRQQKNNKFHTPPGLFKEASAEKIAQVVSENYKAEYRTVSARLNYFLNRGGRNIPEDIRAKVKQAINIAKKKYNRE